MNSQVLEAALLEVAYKVLSAQRTKEADMRDHAALSGSTPGPYTLSAEEIQTAVESVVRKYK